MNGTIRVRLDHVDLYRRVQDEHSLDLKRTLFSIVRRFYRPPERRRVLRNISLNVCEGERIGIIGANGSGKSTLLRAIAGILPPTSGTVAVNGNVAPLIELGAGFDAELSLHDNIVLYGVLLGFTASRMEARIGDILAFAELERERWAPLKTLSSGSLTRLGFAIATDAHPDVLLLDEVFAVGDESFRQKSRARIEEIRLGDCAILLVSHDLNFIEQWCDRAICLQQGRIAFDGAPRHAVRFYLDTFQIGEKASVR